MFEMSGGHTTNLCSTGGKAARQVFLSFLASLLAAREGAEE